MKKLLFSIILTLIVMVGFTQKAERVYSIEVKGGTPSSKCIVPVSADITLITIHRTGTMTQDWDIVPASTPLYNQSFSIIYYTDVVLRDASKTLTIFGAELDYELKDDTCTLFTFWDGSNWYTSLTPSFATSHFIVPKNLSTSIVDASTLDMNATTFVIGVKDAGITTTQMSNLADGTFYVGNTSNRPVAVTPTGDITMSNAGVTDISANAVTTTEILDEAVTVGKMADITRGSIIIGGVSDRPTEVDAKTSGRILIGDGTDVNSIAFSGDIAMSGAGVTTLQASTVGTTEIVDANVTLAKIEPVTAGQIIVGNASNRPTAVTVSGDATMDNTGAITIKPGVVDGTKISDLTTSSITLSTQPTGYQDGVVACRTIEDAQLKPMLDGVQNQIFPLNDGETILGVTVAVQTPAGIAGTIDVGYYHPTIGAYRDQDAIIIAADGNAAALYLSDQNAYAGVQSDYGFFLNGVGDDLLEVTVRSSVNLSTSAIVVQIKMYYIVNN